MGKFRYVAVADNTLGSQIADNALWGQIAD